MNTYTKTSDKINAVVTALTAKGIEHEVRTLDHKTVIGFNSGRDVWHWFELSHFTGFIFFDHSYNRKNGKVSKGLKHGLKLEERFVSYVGHDVFYTEVVEDKELKELRSYKATKAISNKKREAKNLLKFSKANKKLAKGANGRKMYSFSIPAGHTCPFALDCKASVNRETGKLTDGKNTKFRCYEASLEALYPSLRAMLWHNMDLLKPINTKVQEMAILIQKSIPHNAEIVRIHVGGDFFNKHYMKAWIRVAKANPNVLFYAYTKSVLYWIELADSIPANLKLNASKGGKRDDIIDSFMLKEVKVVYSVEEANTLGLAIDSDDTHAYEQNDSFALVIHGTQPKDINDKVREANK